MRKRLRELWAYILLIINLPKIFIDFLRNKNANTSIVISSTNGYSEKTIQPLLKELKSQGFKKSSIFVFEGNHNSDSFNDELCNYYKVKYNSFDLTGLIGLSGLTEEHNNEYNYCLLLHDTIELKWYFKYLFHSADLLNDVHPICLRDSMNIGFYKIEYLERNKSYLNSFKDYSLNNKDNIQLIKAKAVEEEDYLFKISDDKIVPNHFLSILNTNDFEKYHSTIRKKETYLNIGLIKYKANFETRKNWIINI